MCGLPLRPLSMAPGDSHARIAPSRNCLGRRGVLTLGQDQPRGALPSVGAM